MIKVEAPAEYHGLGECLSSKRKNAAEDGSSHKVARKLGALFESDIPDVPNLVQAYGQRASGIALMQGVTSKNSSSYGAFSDYAGVDGTTIWATATSGRNVVTIHLLACMLARIWKQQQAVSVWVELVEQRKEVLRNRISQSAFHLSEAVASRIEFHRSELADWDASARAWLRSADDAKKLQQTQLRLIIDNLSLPVSVSQNVLTAVVASWSKALRALDSLIQGQPLRIQSGDVLLGLSASHLYPDMSVQDNESRFIHQSDPLIKRGGIVTLGLSPGNTVDESGIYWSLPLAYMRYYGDPIETKVHSGLSESQLTFSQFLCVILGAVLGNWKLPTEHLDAAMKVMATIQEDLNVILRKERRNWVEDASWLRVLAQDAKFYLDADGVEKKQLYRLIRYGQRRCANLLCPNNGSPPPFFGLLAMERLIPTLDPIYGAIRRENNASKENPLTDPRIKFLRQWVLAKFDEDFLQDALIEYIDAFHDKLHYMFVLPHKKKRKYGQVESLADMITWDLDFDTYERAQQSGLDKYAQAYSPIGRESLHIMERRLVFLPLGRKTALENHEEYEEFELLCGVPHNVAVYVPRTKLNIATRSKLDKIGVCDTPFLLDSGCITGTQLASLLADSVWIWTYRSQFAQYFQSLDFLASLNQIYSAIPGAHIDIGATSRPLHTLDFASVLAEGTKHGKTLSLVTLFSCIAYFETGYLRLSPQFLTGALALSSFESLYVSSILLNDPADAKPKVPIKRIIGNIGRPGTSILVPAANPRILRVDADSWKVVAHEKFDGKMLDSFSATSLHLSLTGYEVAVDLGHRGARDRDAQIVEATISLHDRGKWIADLDVMKTESRRTLDLPGCSHEPEARLDASQTQNLVSVDNWTELLDRPHGTCIVRCQGNMMARLAAAALCLQRSYDFRILSPQACWSCIALPRFVNAEVLSEGDIRDDSESQGDIGIDCSETDSDSRSIDLHCDGMVFIA
ncbi:hypothetical protein K491DRAFT_626902 [Lophiostoma macrostomum CBS 122681]|uniref:Uncharacterized protein n=1 Tax=Lophiostoma macrostomum CBS 122681 TaxID=1314788 RepID=A0A6A6TBR0_9PLEO|nr:hypothetical protein K491DRAFT_626902 [Lophiostoma macrostomum CBS 122681]